MPVGLEETVDGVKVAPDVTYTNTFQYPERNSHVTYLRGPVHKNIYRTVDTKITFAKPNLSIIARPQTQHVFDETRASVKTLMERGLLKRSVGFMKYDDDIAFMRPIARLNRVPPSTPLIISKSRASKSCRHSSKPKVSPIQPWSANSPRTVPYITGLTTSPQPCRPNTNNRSAEKNRSQNKTELSQYGPI